MASPEPLPGEAIMCVGMPCREGKEHVWQAIDLLRHILRHPPNQSLRNHLRPRRRVSHA